MASRLRLTDNRAGYGWLSILLHWTVAGLTIWLFLNGEAFADLPRGPVAAALRRLHIDWGMVAMAIVLIRIAWRLRQGAPDPGPQPALLNLLAALVQWGLQVALVVICVTGVLNIWSNAAPVNVFGVLSLPSPMTRNPALHGLTERLHSIASHLLLPLIALHVLGGLKHAIVDRDGVFWRMFRPAG